MNKTVFDIEAYSDIGGRRANEDAADYFVTSEGLVAVVADGLGGQGDGQIASSTACQKLLECGNNGQEVTTEDIEAAFVRANAAICEKQSNRFHMKTTSVYLSIHKNTAIWAHAGDTRLYHIYNGKLCEYTLDHSLSQLAVWAGEITRDQIPYHPGQNKVFHALGSDNLEIEIHERIRLKNGKHAFLMCSDGVWENATDDEIVSDLENSASAKEWISCLKERMKKCPKEKQDNNTAIAIIFEIDKEDFSEEDSITGMEDTAPIYEPASQKPILYDPETGERLPENSEAEAQIAEDLNAYARLEPALLNNPSSKPVYKMCQAKYGESEKTETGKKRLIGIIAGIGIALVAGVLIIGILFGMKDFKQNKGYHKLGEFFSEKKNENQTEDLENVIEAEPETESEEIIEITDTPVELMTPTDIPDATIETTDIPDAIEISSAPVNAFLDKNEFVDALQKMSVSKDGIYKIVFESGTVQSNTESVYDISTEKDKSIICWFADGILYIQGIGTIVFPEDCKQLFEDFSALRTIDFGEKIDTSHVTDMWCMFKGCKNLESINLENWDVSHVTDMEKMFFQCQSLSKLELSGWDISNVKTLDSMFYQCNTLSNLNISTWNPQNVTKMSNMFYECNQLPNMDLSSWDTSNVESMDSMFYECDQLDEELQKAQISIPEQASKENMF